MRVHISNLSHEVKTEDLRQLIGTLGVIRSLERQKDRTAEENDGHVIVDMERGEEAKKVAAQLDGKEFRGCRLKVSL